MGVLYVSFRSKVRLITFGCVAMHSSVLFMFRSRLLLYSAWSGVSRVQVILSMQKTLCRYGYMYFLAVLVLVCVDMMVMSYA